MRVRRPVVPRAWREERRAEEGGKPRECFEGETVLHGTVRAGT